MTQRTQTEAVEEIVSRIIGERDPNEAPRGLRGIAPRLDVSRPNWHNTKSDFLEERDAVRRVLEGADLILNNAIGEQGDERSNALVSRLGAAIDLIAKHKQDVSISETPIGLVRRNVAFSGFFLTSLSVVIDLRRYYSERLAELENQEKLYWSSPHRPPNHYARAIALRLARLVARETRTKPTFGIARDGNHPSTEFGRALDELFGLLGIKSSVKPAATWAIAQLTEEDWNPKLNALTGELVGILADGGEALERQNALAMLYENDKKGRI